MALSMRWLRSRRPVVQAGSLGCGDKSRRFLAERVGPVDHYAYSVLILQREFLAAVSAQPEKLDRVRMLALAIRDILVESKQVPLTIIEREPAIRICTR